ncbi:hypothetical protein AB0N79_38695 [Streptomyces microflavus]|uniref:hypothetical protein n=1 Tax=Streptomyces microflavus TaxID=1919 RepID=UPI0022504E25|nr:hypothetical protein [Streptomyces microflavus]MCX4657297.1 hypothetical protein [Streptomyces microflavus]
MPSVKTTYRTTHPSSDREFTVTKGGRPVRWITWADFGDGFVHAGYSSQEEYKRAVRAPRSSNPHAKRYEATAATVVETEQPSGPLHADPAPTAQEAPDPVVAPAEVAEVLDSVAAAHARIVRREGATYLSDVPVHFLAHGLPYEADDDAFSARRAELRRSGRLRHVHALVARVRQALTDHLGTAYTRYRDVTADQIREAARSVALPSVPWLIEDQAGEEVGRVEATSAEEARAATAGMPAVVAAQARGDLLYRRVVPGDIAGPVPSLPSGSVVSYGSLLGSGGYTMPVQRARLVLIRGAQPLAAFETETGRCVGAGAYLEPREETAEVCLRYSPTDGIPRESIGDWGTERTRREAIVMRYAELFHHANWTVEEYRERDYVAGGHERLTGLVLTPPAERPQQSAPGRVTPAPAVAGTTEFIGRSIPSRLRAAGAPGGMVTSEAAGGLLRWRTPDGEELTPGEAAERFIGH